jgi:hypothetical protein
LPAGVQEALKLRFNRGDNGLVSVPGVQASDAAGKIYKAIAVYVFEPCVLRVCNINRRGVGEAAWNGSVTALREGAGFGPGNLGIELNRFHSCIFIA